MRSKGFVSAFFIATTSGHSVQKWKGKEMNRKNMKKLLFAAIAVVIVAKVVRDTKNAKKQKKTSPKGAKSKGYTALAKTTFSLEWL